ncbi:MAG: cytochrome c oxidase subunit II [Bdellovibrionia bacterium]
MNSRFSWVPEQASTIAGDVDRATFELMIICSSILILVFGLMLFFGIRYRKGSPHSREIRGGRDQQIEWGWTLTALTLFIYIFASSSLIYFHLYSPPPETSEIMVVGKQWMWKFQHPNGKRELGELHIPVGKPILLTMTSQDVIHSLYVPAFRIKQDVLPGRYSRAWFQATEPGIYRLHCTQYCGTMHAKMGGSIFAMSPSDYLKWLQTEINLSSFESSAGDQIIGPQVQRLTMASRGGRLFTKLGCISCHGFNPGVRAPSLYGIFGKPQGLSTGATAIADENYIRESILNPKAKIVQGYDPVMPSYVGLVNEEDILDLIAYIKSLEGTPTSESVNGPQELTALPSPPPLRSYP